MYWPLISVLNADKLSYKRICGHKTFLSSQSAGRIAQVDPACSEVCFCIALAIAAATALRVTLILI